MKPIDSENVIAWLNAKIEYVQLGWLHDYGFPTNVIAALTEVKRFVKNLPTIKPEVRRGAWIAVSMFDACGGDEEVWMAHGNPIAYHYCSECKNEAYFNEEGKEIISDYCPFCGADMRDGGADNG